MGAAPADLTEAAWRAAQGFPGVVWTTDRELLLTVACGALLSGAGLASEDVVGDHVEAWAPTDSAVVDAHRRALAGEEAHFTIYAFGRDLTARVSPLLEDGEIVGVVGLATDISTDAALGEALDRRVRHQAYVAELGIAAARGRPPEVLFDQVVHALAKGLDADIAVVSEARDDELEVIARVGPVPPGLVIPLTGSFAAEALERNGAVFIPDTTRDPRGTRAFELGMRSALIVPLTEGARPFGVLGAFATQPQAYSENDVFFVQSLANVVSAALERSASEAMFQTVFEAAPDAIVMSDRNRTIVAANPAAGDLFGIPAGELVGMNALELSADPERLPERFQRLLTGEPFQATLRRKDGHARLVELQGRVLEPGDRVLAFFRDLTEQDRLERQLVQSQKLEVVGQLAAGIAHDFNNLLLAVRGISDLVLQQLPEDSPLREDLEAIRLAGDRGMTIVDRLLMAARRSVRSAEVTAPDDVARESEPLIRSLMPADVEVELAIQPDVGNVVADPSELGQVLLNLVVNARDAMPRGGRVTIALERRELDEEQAAEVGLPPDAYVVLSVTDTGVGMDEDVAARVFEPFFTTKAAGEGTGLGLSMVYGFAQAAGGTAAVESRPGEGARFTLYLPWVAAAEDEGSADPDSLPVGAGTVLLVDDDELSRYVVERTLGRLGYDVLPAASGEEAVALAETTPGLTAIVTDVVMPGLAGAELIDQLSAARPGTPIILVSGHAADSLVRRGITDGRWPLVEKPFTARELGEALRSVV